MGLILLSLFGGFVLIVAVSVNIYLRAYKKDPAQAKANLHTALYGFTTGNTTYLAEKAKERAQCEKEEEGRYETRK